MSINRKGVRTRVQEYPISTKYGKQHNSTVHRNRIRHIGQGHIKNPLHISICGGSQHIFSNFYIRITLFLYGAFSYLLRSKPSLVTIEGTDEIHLMNPEGRWNPGSDTEMYSEDKIMGWERNIA